MKKSQTILFAIMRCQIGRGSRVKIFGKAGLLFQKRHRKLELDIQGLTGRNSLFPQPVFRISIFSVTMKREVLRIDHNFRTGLFN